MAQSSIRIHRHLVSGRTSWPHLYRSPPRAGRLQQTRWAGIYSGPIGLDQVDPQNDGSSQDQKQDGSKQTRDWADTAWKMFESSATTFASIIVLGYVQAPPNTDRRA